MTLQKTNESIANYSQKLMLLNSLSVLHAIYAFQSVLMQNKTSVLEGIPSLEESLRESYAREESLRATPEGNHFGLQNVALAQGLINFFFETQAITLAMPQNSAADSFNEIARVHQEYLATSILESSFLVERNQLLAGLIAEYLVTIDGQYGNPTLFPAIPYIIDEFADRAAAFAVAAFVIANTNEIGEK
jgi:hypothetical protein